MSSATGAFTAPSDFARRAPRLVRIAGQNAISPDFAQ
jgi:hypothetical protein